MAFLRGPDPRVVPYALPPVPRLRQRVLVALAIGLFGAAIAASQQLKPDGQGGDFLVMWRAAHIVLDGGDPYSLIRPQGDGMLATWWYYPLPSIGFALPVVWLPPRIATVVFIGISSSALAFAICRHGYRRLPLFLSVPFVLACYAGQMSLLTFALALIPSARGLTVLKPNLGLALFIARPAWNTALIGGAVILASVMIVPTWPAAWLDVVTASSNHHAPITATLLGTLLLLTILRWRASAARLLLAMSLIPHGLFFYDEVVLWLTAGTHREAMVLTWCSWAAWAGWMVFNVDLQAGTIDLRAMAPWIVALIYLPALVLVLRRPNASFQTND